jgi:hypothetical protein
LPICRSIIEREPGEVFERLAATAADVPAVLMEHPSRT